MPVVLGAFGREYIPTTKVYKHSSSAVLEVWSTEVTIFIIIKMKVLARNDKPEAGSIINNLAEI